MDVIAAIATPAAPAAIGVVRVSGPGCFTVCEAVFRTPGGKAFETLETGDVYINGANGGSHTPHIGMKQSGIGCDQSRWSLEEYFQLKRVSLVP